MYLTRLIYVSTISEDCSPNDIERILTTSKKNNVNHHVTGMLSYNQHFFLQCLEGSRTEVNRTYQRILQDRRHYNVTMLYFQEVNSRSFGDWSMGHIKIGKITDMLSMQFSSGPEFDPYHLTGESAYLMLLELKKQLPST